MAPKKTVSLGDMFKQARSQISATSSVHTNLPDIITFCEGEYYLNLAKKGVVLYPIQKLMLKCFYRGSLGNENITLTEEELQICKDVGLDKDENGDVLSKYSNGEIFDELVLIWGRRSGKDMCCSLIALYEACRVLEAPGGDPYRYYKVDDSNPITILTVATAAPQAAISFREIKSKLLSSKYFEDKYLSEGILEDKIFLLTQKDKESNISFAARKLPLKKGSVVIEAGHSNSSSLLGSGIITVIFDEVASYQLSGGASSGERLYSSIEPSLSTFKRQVPILDENGNPVLDIKGKPKYKTIYDGKSISISSPRGKEGILYDLYMGANKEKNRLVIKLPTWVVNPTHTEESLRERFSRMSEQDFLMEFGAEFSGTAGTSFFAKDLVDKIFSPEIKLRDYGEPGKVYFMHLDPAATSNNYALIILHREDYFNKETKQMALKIIVDHIKYWHPIKGHPVDLDKVDEYIAGMKHRFYIGLITYDAMNDLRSVSKLKKLGIPHKMTRFNSRYTQLIYTNLFNLVCKNEIIIPEHDLLRNEMVNLQKKVTEKGFKIVTKAGADVKTNDIVDCLAGACFQALNKEVNELPRGRLVNTPLSNGSSSNNSFNSMQGTPYLVNPNDRKPFRGNIGGTILPRKV